MRLGNDLEVAARLGALEARLEDSAVEDSEESPQARFDAAKSASKHLKKLFVNVNFDPILISNETYVRIILIMELTYARKS